MREINISEEKRVYFMYTKSLASVAKDWSWKIICFYREANTNRQVLSKNRQ